MNHRIRRHTIKALATFIVFLSASLGASARVQVPQSDKPAAPAANASDVASMDSIVAALYDVISGPRARNAIGTNFDRCSSPARG